MAATANEKGLGFDAELEEKEKKDGMDTQPIASRYRQLNEFTDYTPLDSATQKVLGIYMNKVGKAKEKIPSRPSHPSYEDTYHIALRKGEFHAEVDKTLSEIHRFFLGYGPTIDIIQDGEEFYVASRTIRHLVHNFSGYQIKHDGIYKDTPNPDTDSIKCSLKGLASYVALAYFFGQSDVHGGNWGTQEIEDNCLLAYKIDDADALDIGILSETVTEEGIYSILEDNKNTEYGFSLPEELSRLSSFRLEFIEMFKKVAETDFSKISEILNRNITTNEAYSARWLITKCSPLIAKGAKKVSEETGEPLDDCVQFLKDFEIDLEQVDETLEQREKHDVHFITNLLKKRHSDLQFIFKIAPPPSPTLLTSHTVAKLTKNLDLKPGEAVNTFSESSSKNKESIGKPMV